MEPVATPTVRSGALGDTTRRHWDGALPYVGVFGTALLVLLWCRVLTPGFLLASAVSAAGTLAICVRRGPVLRQLRIPLALLVVALASAAVTGTRLAAIATSWETVVAANQAEFVGELDLRMAKAIDSGRQAAGSVAGRVPRPDGPERFAELEAIRLRSGVAALAVFDPAGEVVAWAGDHRGAIPAEARVGATTLLYAERPLFSYLYVTRRVEERGERIVAAVLLQTGYDAGRGEVRGIAEQIAVGRGARPYFAAGPGSASAWHLVEGGDTIAHAQFEPPSQSGWRARTAATGRRTVVPLAMAALAFVLLAWRRSGQPGSRSSVPLAIATLALASAPLGQALGAERLFSPALFLLPTIGEVSLGRLIVVLLPLAALTAALKPVPLDRKRLRLAVLLGCGAVALGFSGGLRLLVAGAAPGLLEGGVYLWGALQVAAILLLSVLALLALPQGRGGVARPLPIAAGIALSIGLALVVLARWRVSQTVDPWLPAAWAAPFGLLAFGVMALAGPAGKVVRILVVGWLASTVVIPHLWVRHDEARLRAAERELGTLGARPDPFLDYLLHQFAVEAQQRHGRGEDGLELLYRSWVGSGMAREAYPARMAIWSGSGQAEFDLVLGDAAAARSSEPVSTVILNRAIRRARTVGLPMIESTPGSPGLSQVLAIPLDGGRTASVIVPPRRSLDHSSFLAPILGASARPDLRLTLIPAMTFPNFSEMEDSIAWVATDQGWRSDARLRYADGEYHAHLDLREPSIGVLTARAVLLIAINLLLLAILWAIGRAVLGEPSAPPGGWRVLAASFRARITVALFGFFLLPTVLFGTAAYRALSGEAARTARVIAERAVAQAAVGFSEVPGNWRAISDRIGEEVLFFHRGELAQASSPEAVELGFFGAWMAPSVYSALQSGETVGVVESRSLGGQPYVIAYQRLPAGTVAIPVSVSSGESALRQRELAHLILFAAVVGAILSLTLSVLVGRTLARPIGQLRRASAAVGAGRLNVRLPDVGAGEFGELFASFNRMVRRLRRARSQELQTARVLAWGEMSRQVAHEIKNPLTPIKLSVQHLRRAHADGRADFGEILDANVGQVLVEIDRLSEISRAFSRFGAPAEEAGPLGEVDVGAVVREVMTLYQAGDSDIEFRSDVPEGLPALRSRPSELKEVLLNLLENGRNAQEDGGSVTVEARSDGDVVELRIRDEGPGIPPDLLQRIFEPHFSTRSSGTGLGLAIVRRLVESWGGTVTAESEVGVGTTIRMRVPVASAA